MYKVFDSKTGMFGVLDKLTFQKILKDVSNGTLVYFADGAYISLAEKANPEKPRLSIYWDDEENYN